MRKAKYLTLFFLALSYNLTFAQDIGNFTQFFFNPYSLNPSFAGIDGRSALFLAYRKQWSGIDGGPTIANFSFHTPLKSGLSIGVNVANDKRGILSNSGMLATIAYSARLGESMYLRFGISGGGSWNTADLSKIPDQIIGSDPALINLLNQNTSVTGNAGLSLHLKSFHIGAALPNLFTPAYVSEDAFTITEVQPFKALVVHASNRFYFAGDKHVFEPYVVYRINNGLPSQYEVAGVLHLNHLVWLGLSLKQEFGISAFGGIKLNKTFAVGGSYTVKNTGLNELSFPTYEVHLSFLGGAAKSKSKSKSKTAHTPPVYSFVDTELIKKTKTQLLNEKYNAAIAKADKLLTGYHYAEAKAAYQEALKYKPSESYPKTKITEVDKAILYDTNIQKANSELASKSYQEALIDYETASSIHPNEKYPKEKIAEIKALLAKNDTGELERKYKESVAKADAAFNSKEYAKAKTNYTDARSLKPKEQYPQSQLKEIERLMAITIVDRPAVKTPQEPVKETPELPVKEEVKEPVERHETFTRGTSPQELETGNYVIVGAFGSIDNAKKMARRLVDTGLNANYGYLTEKNLWYVHVFTGNDINETKIERDKYRKMPMFPNAWLLTIKN
jgi:type IX secretion system PorP/SprF family membrane protein